MQQVAQTDPNPTTLTAYVALCEGGGYEQEARDLAHVTTYPQFFTGNESKRMCLPCVEKVQTKPVMYCNTDKPVIGRIYDVTASCQPQRPKEMCLTASSHKPCTRG